MLTYEQLVLRNQGYISAELQQRIRATRLLVAGCGVGSTIAETALRSGFETITLADADSVEGHNLNRQCYVADDIGRGKVKALAKRLLAINPSARVTASHAWVTRDNAKELNGSLGFQLAQTHDVETSGA